MTAYGSIKTSAGHDNNNDNFNKSHQGMQQDNSEISNDRPDNSDDDEQEEEAEDDAAQYKSRLGSLSLTTLVICLCITGFFPSLDTTVVFTILNDIGTEFECSNIAAWVHTSYLLVTVMTQLLYSKLSSLFGRQPMLVCVSAFFLIGSIGCSYAASFSQLLVSRVIAGLGGGGSTVMILTVLHDLLPPRIRGQYQSYTYTAQTLGLVCGSPLGGFITEYFDWRVCFKINIIPFLIVLYIFAFRLPNYDVPENVHIPSIKKRRRAPFFSSPSLIRGQQRQVTRNDNGRDGIFKKLYSIDFLGTILLGAANTTFTIGITFGGNTRPWADPFVLSMLGMSAIFFSVFVLYEMIGAAHPLVSQLIISSRNIISLCLGNHLWGLGTSVSFYVLPQLFMGVLGMNSSRAGLSIMVESLSISFASLCTGRYLRRQPHYRNFVLSATVIYTLAIGVFSMWTSSAFPFVLGIICIMIEGWMSGAFVLSTLLAVGTKVPREDVSIVSSLAVMCRLMGYMNGVAIVSAILQGTLKIYLYQHIQGEKDEDIRRLHEFIRTSIRKVPTLSPGVQQIVADGLGLAIQRAFCFALACMLVTFLILFFFMDDNLLWSLSSTTITATTVAAHNNDNDNDNNNNTNNTTISNKKNNENQL